MESEMVMDTVIDKIQQMLLGFEAKIKHSPLKELAPGGFVGDFLVEPLQPGPAPFEVLISPTEILINLGGSGSEFLLPEKNVEKSRGFQAALKFISEILSEGCTKTSWVKGGETVATKVVGNGPGSSAHRRMSIGGIFRIGAEKQTKVYPPYKRRVH